MSWSTPQKGVAFKRQPLLYNIGNRLITLELLQ